MAGARSLTEGFRGWWEMALLWGIVHGGLAPISVSCVELALWPRCSVQRCAPSSRAQVVWEEVVLLLLAA